MRKMIAMMIVLAMGLSLYANNNASDKSRDLSRPPHTILSSEHRTAEQKSGKYG